MKMHNLIFCSDLPIHCGTVAEQYTATVDDIVKAHGWRGSLIYQQTKAVQHDCIFDDNHGYTFIGFTSWYCPR